MSEATLVTLYFCSSCLVDRGKEITGKTGLSKLSDLSESGVKVWTISDVWWSGKFKVVQTSGSDIVMVTFVAFLP